MTRPVLNIDAVAPEAMAPPGGSTRFGAEVRAIGDEMGAEDAGLGVMHVTVQPGMRAFPHHNHLGNDELFIILAGRGVYRFGTREYPIRAGDVCAAPRGGPDRAHQIVNTGDGPLSYYGVSTMNDPDVVEFPDSGKFSTLAIAPGSDFWHAHLRYIGRRDSATGYWDGEDI